MKHETLYSTIYIKDVTEKDAIKNLSIDLYDNSTEHSSTKPYGAVLKVNDVIYSNPGIKTLGEYFVNIAKDKVFYFNKDTCIAERERFHLKDIFYDTFILSESDVAKLKTNKQTKSTDIKSDESIDVKPPAIDTSIYIDRINELEEEVKKLKKELEESKKKCDSIARKATVKRKKPTV
jgi:hypothetical protein